MRNVVLNFFYVTIFSKKAIFLEKMEEKIFGTHDHFLVEGISLRLK